MIRFGKTDPLNVTRDAVTFLVLALFCISALAECTEMKKQEDAFRCFEKNFLSFKEHLIFNSNFRRMQFSHSIFINARPDGRYTKQHMAALFAA